MSYSSLPTSKLFQLTFLTCALALAGCGGDSVDVITPAGGGSSGGNNGGGNNGGDTGGTQTPVIKPDFFLQDLAVNPPNIKLSDEPILFTVTVKAIATNGFSTIKNQDVTLKVMPSGINDGAVTIEGSPTQVTNENGEAVYNLKLSQQAIKNEAELLKNGFQFEASATKSNGGVVTQQGQVRFYKEGNGGDSSTSPVVELDILNAFDSFDNQVGYILNSAGGTTTIQAQLNNQTSGSQIASQSIKFTFDDKKLASLLKVNDVIGSAIVAENTDKNGIVSFKVDVRDDLTPNQKLEFDNKVLTATLTETLSGKQKQVKIKVQSMISAISLIPQQSQPLNLNGGETQIEVIAKNNDGNVVAGQKVFLALPASIASKGVTLMSGGSQTTDNSGKATFTIAVPNNLTDTQKDAIGNSFAIALSAADLSNNIVTKPSAVTTIRPVITGTQENLSIVANKVVSSKGDTFKVFVRLANNKGSIADRNVRLNVDDPIKTGVTIGNNAAKTNGDGVATFELKLEPGANVDQAVLESGIQLTATTITNDNLELVYKTNVAVDIATIDTYQIIVSSEKPTLTTGGDQTNATFRVTDGKGGILIGVPVQLSISNLAASGAALTTPSMVTTDANGQIDVGVLLSANSINARLNHDIDIEAKIVTPTYDANGNVTLTPREQKTLNLVATGTQLTLTASTAKLKAGEGATVTTTLIDGAGRAIAGAGMELVTISRDIDGTEKITVVATGGNTNGDGIASFTVSEDDRNFDDNGNLRLFARATGENKINAQRSLTSIDLVKVSQAGISFIDIKDAYDVNMAQTINIQIRTNTPAEAAALIGKSVEVQTSIGKFTNGQVITTQPIAAANVQGNIITVPVQLTSQLAGTTVLQATVLGEMFNGAPKYQTTVDTRFRATTPAKMLFQAVKSVITPGSSTEVVATVKDKNDVPVEGQTVVFSRTADSSAGRLSAATAVTDARGEARVVYLANASSPIGGVVINANLLKDPNGIGIKTTNITVSKEAVYTTLAFSNKLSSDNIYYTVQGSISVMDGSGRAVANKEVSIKSYATQYAQGKVCLLNTTVNFKAKGETKATELLNDQTPVFFQSNWMTTEDGNYNYTLDKNEDGNGNSQLDPINPVAIIGGTVSDDGYTFVTDSEGRADFSIRYPTRYSNWVKVRFDATTFLNGSENLQSINYQLPTDEADISIVNSTLVTPWIGDASPFGTGNATCVNNLSVQIDESSTPNGTTKVSLLPYQPGYSVFINGESGVGTSSNTNFSIDFNKAFAMGSVVSVSNNGFTFNKVLVSK